MRIFLNDVIVYLQDGTKVFTASTDKQCKMWDLNSNQAIQVAQVIILQKTIILLKKRCIVCNSET